MQKGFINPIIIIVLVVALVGVFMALYSYKTSVQTSKPIPVAIIPSSSPREQVSEPISDNKVEFTKNSGQVVLRYQGKLFIEGIEKNGFDLPKPTSLPNSLAPNWELLATSDEKPDDFSEIFSFKVLPDKESFLTVMRWAGNSIKSAAFSVYLYDNKKPAGQKTDQIDLKQEDPIPKISQISSDGMYAAFTMYSCWNCDSGPKNMVLINLQTKKIQVIPATIYFKWNNNGAYEYKEFIWYDCDDGGMGRCLKDEKDLPLKTGQL